MTPTRRGIACAGNWIIDHIFICDRWPQEETLANAPAARPTTACSTWPASAPISPTPRPSPWRPSA